MEFTNAAAWLQSPQIQDLHSVHDERPSSATEDWKEQAASVQTGGSLNDLLGDIQGEHDTLLPQQAPAASDAFCDSHPSPSPAHPSFRPPVPISAPPSSSPGTTFFIPQLYLSAATGNPYSAVQYGAGSWPSTSAQQLPLSSYSSLNGATTTSHSQGQSQASNSMVIDPALTMNGSASSPLPHFQQAFLQSHPQSRMSYPFTQQSHSPTLSINPSYVHNSSHFQQSQQQQHSLSLPRHHSHSPSQAQTQGTLSPFVLHSPTSGFYTGISPSTFYGHPPQPQAGPSSQPNTPQSIQSATPPATQATSPPAPAPVVPKVSLEQQRADLARGLRPLIQPSSFTGAGAVSQLVNLLDDYGISEVEPSTRLEILTKIRDNAGNHYFRAWVDNQVAMDIIRDWLKLAFVGRNDSQLVETIMPLLHIADRLPFTLEKLKAAKLGKLIMKFTKDPPTPAIKDMASNLERKWRRMVAANEQPDKGDSENTEDSKGKKRRAEGLSVKGAPPVKKAAVPGASATTPKAVPVKKEAKPVVKDAKSDSSFFSKPKPAKKEMPSFKKNPAPAAAPAGPAKKENQVNVAQPSSMNPFEEVLKSLASSVTGAGSSGSTSTPPPGASVAPPVVGPTGTTNKKGKPKKFVTWAPDGKLEQIKLIERAIYDDDPAFGSQPAHTLRDLDRGEGAALHAHLFDEQIEWAEPQPLEIPPDILIPTRGNQSQEAASQEIREQTALIAVYSSPAQIPDSAAEPVAQMAEELVDEGVCVMLTGPDVDAVFWSDGLPALVEGSNGSNGMPPPSASVAELVGQLAAAGAATGAGGGPDILMSDASQAAMSSVYGINAEQLQQLMQHAQALAGLGAPGGGGAGPPTQPGWAPGDQYSEYDRGYHEAGGARGGDGPRRWNEDGGGGGGGWAPGAERGGPGRGRGLRGGTRGMGRGRGDGFRSTKRKPCNFFLAGRCRYGDQCDFSHELTY